METLGLIVFLSFVLWCLTLAALIERIICYGRNFVWWLIVGIIFTPIVAILLILVFGETLEKRKQRIEEEEKWRIACRNEK